jgi:pyrimidine deaminase RibD-like protein
MQRHETIGSNSDIKTPVIKMSTKLSTPKIRSNIEFLQKYESALQSIITTFREEKPDYILALSRKAPRLLELLRLSGLWSGNIPVISEKALDFIPMEQLRHKKVVVFDDIIISGTTITNLVAELMRKYQVDVMVLCLAIDVDTIALKKDSNGDYKVTLDDGSRIPVYYKAPQKQDDRFIFCNEIVRSFAFLNKPYDIDFPIFYAHLNARPLDSPSGQTRTGKSYNLTTVYQYNAGFSRYTLLPANTIKIDGLCNAIIKGFSASPNICKVREYVNNKTGEAVFCPMVTFQINSGLLKGNKLFSGDFSYYDELIEIARSFINHGNETQAVYRLVCYVVSYLYGLSFSLRSMEGDENFGVMRPSDVLNRGDLSYIFGPGLTEMLLYFLDSHHAKTLDLLKRVREPCGTAVSDGEQNQGANERAAPAFDKKREELYSKILSYITTHVHTEQSLTDRIALIFEGLYCCGEIPVQDALRKNGIRGGEDKRLGVGMNYDQIREILWKNEFLGPDSRENDLGISLALDFLVDAGIVIPIFFCERSDGIYERAYRYGEDALSAKKYGYLIASTMKSLFEYIRQANGQGTLLKISFEKQGVLLQKEIERTGIVDLLKELLPSGDRDIAVSQRYARHGKILHISDEAYERSKYYPYMFNEWCEKEGIVNAIVGGVIYSSRFFEGLRLPNGHVPRLIPADKIAVFESLAMLLYQVDKLGDREGQSDYLIALTACGDRESYLWALREELNLFFKSKDYSFSESLGRTASYLNDVEHKTRDFLEEALTWCNRSLSAAHGIRHKKKLRDRIPQIVDEIEKHFAGGGAQLRLLYDQNLRFHIEKIKATHSMPLEPAFEKLKWEVEVLGESCILLASILEHLLELMIKIRKMRITKESRFHLRDAKTAAKYLDNLHNSVAEWNTFIEGNTITSISGLSSMPTLISDKSSLSHFKYDKAESNELVASIIPVIQENYAKLEQVYDRDYLRSPWRDKMNQLFPDGNNLELAAVKMAIEASEKCVPEDDRRIHPKVGAAIITKDGRIICAYRGEKKPGDHAEYTVLFDREKAQKLDLHGATLVTTLEPCTSRKHDNKPCALHIAERGIQKVIVGMIDPNPQIRGKGILFLQRKNIKVDLFPPSQQEQVRKLNSEFWDQEWKEYKFDIMKDPDGTSEKQIENIAGDFYSLDFHRIRVFEVLRQQLSKEEVKILCETYLGMEYHDLQGDTRIDKISSLVSCFARKDALDSLLEAIGRFNPGFLRLIRGEARH